MAYKGTLPGRSYEYMVELIRDNRPANCPFSPELILAICWEESSFNNQEQLGGTAWGFGQVEPAEFDKLQGPQAAYPVLGLPSVTHYKVKVMEEGKEKELKKARLNGTLTEQQSIQVVISILLYNLQNSESPMGALKKYAGVGYSGPDVPTHLSKDSARVTIIKHWLACEAHLKNESNWVEMNRQLNKIRKPGEKPLNQQQLLEYKRFLKTALGKAKGFPQEDPTYDDVLFPKNFISETGEKIWWPKGSVGSTYDMLVKDMQSRGLL